MKRDFAAMTPRQHIERAAALLEDCDFFDNDVPVKTLWATQAQVHSTLAVALLAEAAQPERTPR